MSDKKLTDAKILIVDDQPLAQSYMRQSLESLGFKNIWLAEHANTALAQCREIKFTLILCSFNLGRSKDGYHLYEELRTQNLIKHTTGFVFISAETDPSLVHSVLELQPDDFLVKPFSLKVFGDRINRILKRKHVLHDVLDYIDCQNYSKALRTIDEKLGDAKLSSYYPILLRLKGELLLSLNRIAEAKEFFKSVLSFQKFTWARVGLVESLIKNSEFENARNMLELMVSKPETRLVACDLLGKLELYLQNYQRAQELLSEAATLAPRNIDRQGELINLSKLNHDYAKHYEANREILKYAKYSIHDKPDIYLNVARAGVDYALTLEQNELIARLARQSNDCLNDLKKQFPNAQTQEQIDIVNARIHYLRDERQKALELVAELEDDSDIDSIDDALDKAKLLHELGFNERADNLFKRINEHCEKYFHQDHTLLAYLKQEAQERADIKMGPRELNNSAVEFYQKGRYSDALHLFEQAFRIMPKNPNIALNLLQTLCESSLGMSSNKSLIRQCVMVIEDNVLTTEQGARYAQIKPLINRLI